MKYEIPEMCFQCHEEEDYRHREGEGGILHSPVEDGACSECHHPHESRFANLLVRSSTETCLTCHEREDYVPEREKTKMINAVAHLGECDTCHAPHRSRFDGLLSRPLVDICFECHEIAKDHHPNVRDIEASLPWSENPDACSKCHDPHGISQNREFSVSMGRHGLRGPNQ